MIKKRGKIFLLGIIFITIIIVSFTMLAKIQLEQFNKAYIKEEKEEISALAKQVSWAVKPILKSKNYEELAEYCDLFKDSDTRITINDNKDKPVIGKKITNNFQTEGTFVDSQYVYYVMPMKIDNLDYTLIIYTATKHMNITLHKSGRYILLSILAGAFIVISLAVYLLGTYKSFNRLQDSAVKISEGDLDTNIFIPRGGILFELSYALDKMAKRLKKQIVDMQKLENFRSEFIANVSHEVKTPLTGIMSSVEILEDECSSENMKITKCLSILKKQANRLNSLIQDILSLSELERRQIMEKKEFCRFNLKHSIENSVAIVYTSEISINTNLENIAYYGDSSLIEQAVINLLTNAIRYSKSDRIDVSLFKTSDSVKIIVKDYGVGIPKEHLPYIFEHFYRADKARSRDLGGTGLGLAIVKNIIKLHSGEIEVKSDNGCEFVITLPLC